MSIYNQVSLLKSYVSEKSWNVYNVYIDDGISGTTFNRPQFKKMIEDIEDGNINCVLTKDLSRLGRNYVETGQYTDFFFPNHNVRYIAINDGIDTAKEDNDIAPFKNILNEMYAKDISRKVRSTKRIMAEQGKFSNSRAPYGYLKSPENKHILIVDNCVSHNVVRIFELYLSGTPARAIADIFNKENIMTPNEYYFRTIGKSNPFRNNKNSWGSASVMNMIKNPIYYGAMANGKRAVSSFKNKRMVIKNFDEWIIVENTHEPLISKDMWNEAQRISFSNKRDTVRRSSNGEVSLFAGLIKCADCSGNMIFNRKIKKVETDEFYRCGTYQQKGKYVCTPHKIHYEVLYDSVLLDVRQYAVLAITDEQKLIDRIFKANNEFKNSNLQRHEKTIRECKSRIHEIDGLFQSLFEEKVAGNVSDDMFKRMTQKYEVEQSKLSDKLEQSKVDYVKHKNAEHDMAGWTNRIKNCLQIETLTRDLVVELIDRIEVSEQSEIDGTKHLDLKIFYKFGIQNASSSSKEKRAS